MKNTKFYLISLSIICLLLFYSTITLCVKETSEKGKKNTIQKQFDEVTVIRHDLEAELKNSKMTNAELKAHLKTEEDSIAGLTNRLDEQKAANVRSVAKLQEKEIELQELKSKLDTDKLEKDSLLKRLEKVNEDFLSLKSRMENVMKANKDLEEKQNELAEKEGIPLGTIVVNQPSK